MIFYDKRGKATCYTNDNDEIYSFDGTPLGFIYSNLIYKVNGEHLGFLDRGWIIDRSGYAVYFSENSSNIGLVTPIKCVKPIASVKRIFPVKGIRRVPSTKPVFKMSWSSATGTEFFS